MNFDDDLFTSPRHEESVRSSGDARSEDRPRKEDVLAGCPNVPRHEIDLISTIGEGGFCEVWEGRWFGAPVALKILKLTGDAEQVRRYHSKSLGCSTPRCCLASGCY